jgi:hypothetical protein
MRTVLVCLPDSWMVATPASWLGIAIEGNQRVRPPHPGQHASVSPVKRLGSPLALDCIVTEHRSAAPDWS